MKFVIPFLLLVAYGWGVWKFWKGYDRTNFQASLISKVTVNFGSKAPSL
ncbi:hypothetical protein PN441_12465 [Spirulina major CS-329]|nr:MULTISPECIES: hypothetical protein [Spirulina]MDB9493573.1 hypothetical protein [Spirulina subsalsa CS-330]MDB9503885.1 hypothetical protein [Spirulina major CS-329]